jgi:hypothetical protein
MNAQWRGVGCLYVCVSSPELFRGFQLNFVLGIHTESFHANLILVRVISYNPFFT